MTDHNELYDVLDNLRGIKRTKQIPFDYECPADENDRKYLQLTCIEGKLLKYILIMEMKINNNKLKIIENSDDGNDKLLDIGVINGYLIDLRIQLNYFLNHLKSLLANLLENDPQKKPNIVLEGLTYFGAFIFCTTIGLPYTIYSIYEIIKQQQQLSLNEKIKNFDKKTLNKYIKNIEDIITIISDIIDKTSSLRTVDRKIKINNICINGITIGGIIKHKKCTNKDYKRENIDINFIKRLFNQIDKSI